MTATARKPRRREQLFGFGARRRQAEDDARPSHEASPEALVWTAASDAASCMAAPAAEALTGEPAGRACRARVDNATPPPLRLDTLPADEPATNDDDDDAAANDDATPAATAVTEAVTEVSEPIPDLDEGRVAPFEDNEPVPGEEPAVIKTIPDFK